MTFNLLIPKSIRVFLSLSSIRVWSMKFLGWEIFELSHYNKVWTDGQTDGQTDTVITIGLPHLRWRGPNDVKYPLLWEFLINIVYRRILGRVLVGNIVNIRNECLYFLVHGEWIGARNKQIVQEPLRGSRDLFVPRSDSFPMNPEKKTLIP